MSLDIGRAVGARNDVLELLFAATALTALTLDQTRTGTDRTRHHFEDITVSHGRTS